MARRKSSPYIDRLRSSPSASPRSYRDSPSRHLERDLERTFANIRLHEQESQKLYLYNRKVVQDDLDAKEFAQAAVHNAGIEESLAQHEIIRQQAVAVLEAHIKEEEDRRRREVEDRQRREAEEKRKADEQRRAREEKERKARELQEKAAADKKEAEQKAKAEREESDRRKREDTAKAEKEARAKAEAETTAAEKEKQEADAKAAVEKPTTDTAPPSSAPTSTQFDQPWSSDPEIRHGHYLAIHRKLKTFRKDFWASAKKDSSLKNIVGDMRRTIRVGVGQLTSSDKRQNSANTKKIQETLLQAALKIPSPPIPLNDYLPPHLNLLDKNTTTIPSLLLYLINIFSKSLISAFTGECSVNPSAADPLGTMAAQVFSMPELSYTRNIPSPTSGLHYDRFGGTTPTPPLSPSSVTLITILISKFHAVAPILFGITGSELTPTGRQRLGWRKESGAFIQPQAHYDRLIGLAAGYAALSLRNFSKARRANPYPPTHFWEALANIVNTLPAQVQTSHLLLLRNLLETGYDRFVLFFGADAIAALRHAVVIFPRSLSAELRKQPAGLALEMMGERWGREKNFHLDL